MRKEPLLLLFVLIFLGGFLLFSLNRNNKNLISNPLLKNTPYPTIETGNNTQNITLAPSSSKNIEVLSPRAGDKMKSGSVIKGNARVFENVVSIRLVDSFGNILTETNSMANAPDTGQFGPFEKEIEFQTDSKNGVLEVFQYSAKDGSEIDKVSIPIVF